VKRTGIAIVAAACAAMLLLAAGSWISRDAAAEDKQTSEGEWGSVTGQFILDGEVPPREIAVRAGAPVNNAPICSATDIPSDSLIIDPQTRAIADIFVYLPKAEKVHPDLKESREKEVVFDQKGCRFIPHALFARTDQVVRVKSADNCAHNTKTNPLRNQAVNFALTPNDREGVEVKNKVAEKLPIEVQCNIHNWMSARWLILDHPYAAISDEKGKFTIADLPAGEHELLMWQERAGYVERKYKITVVAGQTTNLGTIKVPVAKFSDKK
jgi:hypothetical protein